MSQILFDFVRLSTLARADGGTANLSFDKQQRGSEPVPTVKLASIPTPGANPARNYGAIFMRRGTFSLITAISLLLSAQVAMAGITFSRLGEFPISPQPDYLVAGDVNNDGLDDVVVVSPRSDEVNVLLADPIQPSGFSPVAVAAFGRSLRRHDLGDLNADGRLDLVVVDQRADGVWVLLGDGTGRFQFPTFYSVGRVPYAVAIGNFDGVRGNDIALSDDRLDHVSILLNDGGSPPRFTRGPVYAVGEQPRTLIAVDVSGDDRLDLVTLNEGGPRVKSISVLVFQGVTAGLPVFADKLDFGVGENPSAMSAADVNGDGSADLVMLNRVGVGENDDVNVMINRGDGVFLGPTRFPVPCPFFTGGVTCRTHALAVADYDNNGDLDLAVTLTDPLRNGSGSGTEADAMQIFSGRGDGNFSPGGVLRTPEGPLSLVAVEITGDDLIDLAGGFTINITGFTNTSTPGDKQNGDQCFLGEECLSARCINGVCCASACENGERCDVPGHLGICQPLPPPPTECAVAGDCEDLPDQPVCVDGYCCNTSCDEGRCDVAGFEGLCVPALDDGALCQNDFDCKSGFCSDGHCCKERCDNGNCGFDDGVCRALLDNGDVCNFDEDCQSGICDPFVAICCSMRCRTDQDCAANGEGCVDIVPPTPRPNGDTCEAEEDCESGNCVNNVCCVTDSCPEGQVCLIPDGECGVEPTPAPNGQSCTGDRECTSGNCVNFVCCSVPSCPDGTFCALETGTCQEGTPPPTPTPTATRTASATRTRTATPVECGSLSCDEDEVCSVDSDGAYCAKLCGDGQCGRREQCSNGLCVISTRKSGCAVTRDGSVRDLWLILLAPALLVLVRRGDRRIRVRARQK